MFKRKEKKNIENAIAFLFFLFLVLQATTVCAAQDESLLLPADYALNLNKTQTIKPNTEYFNLSNIVDNIFNNDTYRINDNNNVSNNPTNSTDNTVQSGYSSNLENNANIQNNSNTQNNSNVQYNADVNENRIDSYSNNSSNAINTSDNITEDNNVVNDITNNVNNDKVQENKNYYPVSNLDDNSVLKKMNIRKDFIQITSKFNQGNATVAYDEYNTLIEGMEQDLSLLALARVLYEIGFFSLGNKALDKIVFKNQYHDNIQDLNRSYIPKATIPKEEEIYFAKLYSSIYFDNSAQETVNELLAKKSKYNKNDFYNYTLARAYLESKKYSDALSSINKAISQAPNTLQYQIFKIDVLVNSKKYQDALKLIQKFEKMPDSVNFAQTIAVKKEHILAQATKNDKLKKYHTLEKTFLEGNYEKVKKDCQNILNFDKDNSDIITMYAKSELALGNVERANAYYVNAYRIDKTNIETIVGIGDIKFLHKDYKNAVKMYKKAYSRDSENYETIIKLATAQREYAKNQKELRKLEQKLDSMPKNFYAAYYRSALSIAQKNDVLKEDFLKRTLTINPMYENSIGALIELYLKNNNFQLAKSLIAATSFTLEKNYYYYYLCGLYNQAINKKRDAIQFYKTSLNLNPSFEIANTKLLKLIPDSTGEEI